MDWHGACCRTLRRASTPPHSRQPAAAALLRALCALLLRAAAARSSVEMRRRHHPSSNAPPPPRTQYHPTPHGAQQDDPLDILLAKRDGRFSGEAYVLFGTAAQVQAAVDKNKSYMGRRYVEVFRAKKLVRRFGSAGACCCFGGSGLFLRRLCMGRVWMHAAPLVLRRRQGDLETLTHIRHR